MSVRDMYLNQNKATYVRKGYVFTLKQGNLRP